jgi:hypothetical protein
MSSLIELTEERLLRAIKQYRSDLENEDIEITEILLSSDMRIKIFFKVL